MPAATVGVPTQPQQAGSASEYPQGAAATVRALVALAGLKPSPDEIEVMTDAYPLLISSIASLYTMTDCRYESPGIVFDAAPAFSPWHREGL